MKSRIVLGVLAVIGIFALSVETVQAGSGEGVPAFLNTFFECQVIDGANVNQVVSTCNPGSDCLGNNLIHDTVNVGNGVLLCRQVDVKNSAGVFFGQLPGSTETLVPSQLVKCYAVSRPGRKGSAVDQTLTDVFVSETASISNQPGYLCGPVGIGP